MGIFTHDIINPSKTLEERFRPNFNICVTGALLGRTSFVSPCAIQEELLAKAPEVLGKEATYRWFKLIAGQFSCNTVFVLQFSSVFSRVFQSISQAAGHISHVRVWVQPDEFFDLVDLLLRRLPPSPAFWGLSESYCALLESYREILKGCRSWNFSCTVMVKFGPILLF